MANNAFAMRACSSRALPKERGIGRVLNESMLEKNVARGSAPLWKMSPFSRASSEHLEGKRRLLCCCGQSSYEIRAQWRRHLRHSFAAVRDGQADQSARHARSKDNTSSIAEPCASGPSKLLASAASNTALVTSSRNSGTPSSER